MAAGNDVALEEQLTSFTVLPLGASRIQRIDAAGAPSWNAPQGFFIEDAALHPSGAVSAVLVDTDFGVWLARLAPDLALLELAQLVDPAVATDPFPDAGFPPPTTLTANSLPRDSVRTAADGEDAVVAVITPLESVLLYRIAFTTRWEAPRRTLVLPVTPHTPFLPIGGTFDTFGAMWSSFGPLLDVDPDGNAYLAFWANPGIRRSHAAFTGDDLAPVSPERFSQDSDVLLEKFDRSGARQWSRLIGTVNEDEPYALRATTSEVAVVGRARRFPGFDNTFWDAFLSVSGGDGTVRPTRRFELDASSILLAVDALPNGGWVVGGSEGWAQNPEGLSVLSFGTKLLAEVPAADADLVRIGLPAGPRHNEIRTVLAGPSGIWFGGHEDGPVMHTGDGDPSQIHATGVLGFMTR
ncbi:MAG TPA: hypothetical protein VMT11_10295 [Myxococcaceae bacterium]|nr:hypothetical protein [Myxococcaceae bacterium]